MLIRFSLESVVSALSTDWVSVCVRGEFYEIYRRVHGFTVLQYVVYGFRSKLESTRFIYQYHHTPD